MTSARYDLLSHTTMIFKANKAGDIKKREDNMNKEIIFKNFVTSLLNTLNAMMVLVFTTSPLVLIAVKYIKTGEVELLLPFLDVYPFDPYDMRYYPFLYIKQIWSGKKTIY